MAKVKMLVSLAGADYSVNAGELHECDIEEAARLIGAGMAESAVEKRVESRPSTTKTATRKSV